MRQVQFFHLQVQVLWSDPALLHAGQRIDSLVSLADARLHDFDVAVSDFGDSRVGFTIKGTQEQFECLVDLRTALCRTAVDRPRYVAYRCRFVLDQPYLGRGAPDGIET
jgi:hypothetical protein